MNFKRTKLIAKILVLVLLVTSALSFVGCEEPHVKKGQYYSLSEDFYFPIAMKIVSNTKEFSLDDVTLQLYVGLHRQEVTWLDLFFRDKNKSNNTIDEPIEISDYDKNCCYLILIYNPSFGDISNEPRYYFENYTEFNPYILKEISYEESLKNEKYSYTRYPNGQYYYNYSQTITIPQEYFVSSDRQVVCIAVLLVEKLSDNSGYGYILQKKELGSLYTLLDDETLTLDFDFRE